jgi:hypothetical protein
MLDLAQYTSGKTLNSFLLTPNRITCYEYMVESPWKKPPVTDEADTSKSSALEAEVWSAISAFEQILQAMPNDRASLEVLSHAYEQIGDHTRAVEYYLRLGEIVAQECDVDAAATLVERIASHGSDDTRVRALVERLRGLSAPREAKSPAPAKQDPQPKTSQDLAKGFNIASELSLAWNLLEANELTQEEYAEVVQDLSEMSTGESVATVSVLHVLEARGSRNLDRIMAFLCKQCETPLIALDSFELQVDAMGLLPLEFMIRRGAAIFDALGKDALVVVMNPYDQQLRKDVEMVAGRRCHYFMVRASEFDRATDRYAQAVKKNIQPPAGGSSA